jgi:hypothetical protein
MLLLPDLVVMHIDDHYSAVRIEELLVDELEKEIASKVRL